MKKHFNYLWYLIRHKWFVFYAGLIVGAPLWRLIIHDWSKFTPREWFAYADFFYGGVKSPAISDAFDVAVLHHIHVNAHHWQHWVLPKEDGRRIPVRMPEKLVLEMVADWAGAGRAKTGKWDLMEWFNRNQEIIVLHCETLLRARMIINAHFGGVEARKLYLGDRLFHGKLTMAEAKELNIIEFLENEE